VARAGRATAIREHTAESSGVGADRAARAVLPAQALDDRIAIVGTAGSGKTYAAKGFVERLLESGVRIAIVDPLGVWWGLRASADGSDAGYPVVVFGGRHADVAISADMGPALGRLIAEQALASIIDLSELGSNAARRRFMAGFAEALYETNQEPLHLILDEADLWAPQRPIKGWEGLLGHIEEIVRRGRVRGFIPWLITQRPAVVHKDVLSQADILIAMKLTASQDRDAIGAWIEGQADRQDGKRILGELPRLPRGGGYLWAPAHGILDRVAFPEIRTFDSSRTPKRGERRPVPQGRAEIDLTAITAAIGGVAYGASRHARGPALSRSPLNNTEDILQVSKFFTIRVRVM
jgi:DNA helicase HerA-like ATPase